MNITENMEDWKRIYESTFNGKYNLMSVNEAKDDDIDDDDDSEAEV